jgi:hypothetical protein
MLKGQPIVKHCGRDVCDIVQPVAANHYFGETQD